MFSFLITPDKAGHAAKPHYESPRMDDLIPIRRALISVSDKTGLVDLGRALVDYGVEIISTGGTAQVLREHGLNITDVTTITGFPEIMDGRVKTLHPHIHGGILAQRDNTTHQGALDTHGIAPIDLVVVDLYPFEAALTAHADPTTLIENIDIGGPAMIRAAAKNHTFVTIMVQRDQYPALLTELAENNGQTRLEFRQKMALAAFGRTATYDAAISNWMAQAHDDPTPPYRAFGGMCWQALRYGENPHQTAALYADGSREATITHAHQIQGKSLSYNNIADADAALRLVAEFSADDGPACAIIKHANPCGVAQGQTLAATYKAAFDCDRNSAFGGIIAVNHTLDPTTAKAIIETFVEVVVAPSVDMAAQSILATRPGLRVLTTGALPDPKHAPLTIKQVTGGFLVQSRDTAVLTEQNLRVATARAPTAAEIKDMVFAWRVAKHVTSNAIVYAKQRQTIGIGAGQMSRIDSVRIATQKAQDMAETLHLTTPPTMGAVIASDAFFPFADGVLAAADAGITAVIQPGGSRRDDEIIATADAAGIAMVFTGLRHFRH